MCAPSACSARLGTPTIRNGKVEWQLSGERRRTVRIDDPAARGGPPSHDARGLDRESRLTSDLVSARGPSLRIQGSLTEGPRHAELGVQRGRGQQTAQVWGDRDGRAFWSRGLPRVSCRATHLLIKRMIENDLKVRRYAASINWTFFQCLCSVSISLSLPSTAIFRSRFQVSWLHPCHDFSFPPRRLGTLSAPVRTALSLQTLP